MVDIGSRVRQAREARDLTQRDVARLAGVSRQTILNLESNVGKPDLATLLAVAEVIHASPADLLGFDPEPETAEVREIVQLVSTLPLAGRRYVRDMVKVAVRPMAAMTQARPA